MHKGGCIEIEPSITKILMHDMVFFKPKNYKLPVKFWSLCDFECLKCRVEQTLDLSEKVSKTRNIYHLKPFAPG